MGMANSAAAVADFSQPKVGAYPNALDAVLNEIAAQGGPDVFLRSIGISDEEIAVIRSHATE